MLEKRDVDAEHAALVDSLGMESLELLRSGLAERPYGSLTLTFHWKAHMLSKLEVHENGERLLNLPKRA